MKHILFVSLSLALSACVSTAPTQTPQQVAARACAILQPALVTAQAFVLPPDVTAQLAVASNVVSTACVVGAVTPNIQALAATAVPAIQAAIKASDWPADKQNEALAGVAVAQIVLQSYLAAP